MVTSLLGFVFALAESGLGLGAILPGEVAISSLATNVDGVLPLLFLGIAVALGASAGDHLGYVIGRLSGPRLRSSRLIARLGLDRWDRASELMQAHGFWAILVSRLLPFVRTVMPAVAGAAHLRYPRFALASVLGAVAWSSVWVGAGAGLAASGLLNNTPLVVATVAGAIVAAVAIRVVRKRRRPAVPADPSALEALGERVPEPTCVG
ncbi:DedA family protein [Aeromicrobium ginsengisoli]|uniref:DedA family protein n=1 Tax=Aeromicrobium ginsengisoli TaxID=363867 RepID=A0A5M4FGZ9_9ACTN|nr:DedA family protein [Aeromicrobium ginsengisoli]KAA1399446.1 DedA family protein [Aeromicrobium ginsengisoli]